MIKLKECPFCGKEPRWCGIGNKDVTDDHDCHHIHCDSCGTHFDIDNFNAKDAETIESMRSAVAIVWNSRCPWI